MSPKYSRTWRMASPSARVTTDAAKLQAFPGQCRIRVARAQPAVRVKQLESGFVAGRQRCYDALPEFEALRDRAKEILDHTLDNLDAYLLEYEARVLESGGLVHWASTPEEAREIVIRICRDAEAKTVIRGKSMIGEECDINEALEVAKRFSVPDAVSFINGVLDAVCTSMEEPRRSDSGH